MKLILYALLSIATATSTPMSGIFVTMPLGSLPKNNVVRVTESDRCYQKCFIGQLNADKNKAVAMQHYLCLSWSVVAKTYFLETRVI